MFIYILLLVSMGCAMLVAGRHDIVDGNYPDGRFLISLGALALLASIVVLVVPI